MLRRHENDGGTVRCPIKFFFSVTSLDGSVLKKKRMMVIKTGKKKNCPNMRISEGREGVNLKLKVLELFWLLFFQIRL